MRFGRRINILLYICIRPTSLFYPQHKIKQYIPPSRGVNSINDKGGGGVGVAGIIATTDYFCTDSVERKQHLSAGWGLLCGQRQRSSLSLIEIIMVEEESPLSLIMSSRRIHLNYRARTVFSSPISLVDSSSSINAQHRFSSARESPIQQ